MHELRQVDGIVQVQVFSVHIQYTYSFSILTT